MPHLPQVPVDSFALLKVALSSCNTEARECHHCCCDVQSADGYCPLRCSNHGLVLLDASTVKQLGGVHLGVVPFFQGGSVHILGFGSKEALVGSYHLFNVLLQLDAEYSTLITNEVTTQVICKWAGTLQAETILCFELILWLSVQSLYRG